MIALDDLPEELPAIAREVAALAIDLDDQERQTLSTIALAALAGMKRGSTRLPLFELREILPGGLALLDDPRTAPVIGRPGDYKPLILDGDHLYLQRLHRGEERFAETLAKRARSTAIALDREALRAALRDIRERPAGVQLSEKQLEAVERAVSAPLAVISGGPGTGKTSIVVAIVRVLARLGLTPESFALAAPTGKAANRIAESIERSLAAIRDPADVDRALSSRKPEPRTLHRLLIYNPTRDRFLHHENNPLSERAVIVDESSMIDLFLMDRLARSVRNDARLVLLGDAEQLPSVDAGTVLRDISGGALSVTLEESFRMREDDPAGRHVLTVARAIKDGRVEDISVRREARDVVHRGVEIIHGAAQRTAFLKRWYLEKFSDHPRFQQLASKIYELDRDRAELDELFAHLGSFKILCVTKSDAMPTGAAAINAQMHAKAAGDAAIGGENATAFVPGEPIMVMRNDYERRLFNGDQGVVLRVRDATGAIATMAVFAADGRYQAFHLEPLGELITLAHAITVHKAQGSEYDAVLVLLPERDVPLLTREVLYTALTRCRKSAVIAGDREILLRGAERKIRRYSGLPERLARWIASSGPSSEITSRS
jgi:exodeoxyribonuclease V alpha subunit